MPDLGLPNKPCRKVLTCCVQSAKVAVVEAPLVLKFCSRVRLLLRPILDAMDVFHECTVFTDLDNSDGLAPGQAKSPASDAGYETIHS